MPPSTILVVAAHPDDEVLGCGGTLAKHADDGDIVHVLIVAEGATSRSSSRNVEKDSEKLRLLVSSAHQAAEILGIHNVTFLNQPDNRLDSLDRLELIKLIEKHVRDIKPDVVYVHHSGDLNIDHRRLHEAVLVACRPQPCHTHRKILSFEVSSSTDWQPPSSNSPFVPTYYVDITHQLDRKINALETYYQEMKNWPHSRSVSSLKHLAHHRGSQVGVDAAEAFILLRQLA